ncbi:phage tail sheath family protein [Paraburkholderia sp. Tr-20389]|uniref:phage tail sheath family protein n=1 Tax=Paraburkholderia sp. Tr-20389 TaxID=2703903 RepID=UPI00197FC679|nr:phage tail sheath C-terminal domain-containing protein [Paraburkholderia sp. Tr-20389]MBN3753667.1 phage tail sheath family protein [Paraburkholderia sp. Tr-20389]
MPVTTSYPGIYIQERQSLIHTVTAAPTNIAVFIGYTHPLKTVPKNLDQPYQIFGFADYQRQFGGFLHSQAYANAGSVAAPAGQSFGDMAQAVNQFFLNGGTNAYVVSLDHTKVTAGTATVAGITFTAREITDDVWEMQIAIVPVPTDVKPSPPVASPPVASPPVASPPAASPPVASPPVASPPVVSPPVGSPPVVSPKLPKVADIVITYRQKGVSQGQQPAPAITETYRRVSLDTHQSDGTLNPNYIFTRFGTQDSPVSNLVTVSSGSPAPTGFPAAASTLTVTKATLPTPLFASDDFKRVMQDDFALDKLPVFNLMNIPGVVDVSVLSTAEAFCERKRAFLIVDPPVTDSADGTLEGFSDRIQDTVGAGQIPQSANGALYFPYLYSPDPFTGATINSSTRKLNEIPPGATVAGLFAATDLARGVWKAPAGFQTTARNVTGVVERGRMTDPRQGVLNPIGVNCLRDFPNIPTVVFGARTLVTLTNEQWRYVPVRRMALFLEQSLYASLGWVVFEPNADPTWKAITLEVTGFMYGLFRQGAFAGTTTTTAFDVQCNSQTTTQDDINNGIVNIVVSFAPLKPAEFVVITIAQIAGQTQTT